MHTEIFARNVPGAGGAITGLDSLSQRFPEKTLSC